MEYSGVCTTCIFIPCCPCCFPFSWRVTASLQQQQQQQQQQRQQERQQEEEEEEQRLLSWCSSSSSSRSSRVLHLLRAEPLSPSLSAAQ
ncbi:hypothetical protein ACSSS7_004561 [Eimeria intestinalis]